MLGGEHRLGLGDQPGAVAGGLADGSPDSAELSGRARGPSGCGSGAPGRPSGRRAAACRPRPRPAGPGPRSCGGQGVQDVAALGWPSDG